MFIMICASLMDSYAALFYERQDGAGKKNARRVRRPRQRAARLCMQEQKKRTAVVKLPEI